jgi:hypothetical protein
MRIAWLVRSSPVRVSINLVVLINISSFVAAMADARLMVVTTDRIKKALQIMTPP